MLTLSQQGWCLKEYAGRTLLWAISEMAGRSATTRVGFDTASVKTTCTAQMLQGLNSHRLLHCHSPYMPSRCGAGAGGRCGACLGLACHRSIDGR